MDLLFRAVLCAFFGLIVNINSLQGTFTFDDRFAVVENGDTLPSASWSQLWQHDFWGQPLHSNSSHKSFRPLTVAVYKAIRLVAERTPATTAATSAAVPDGASSSSSSSASLSPLPFHMVNVAVHALNCFMLVYVYGRILTSTASHASSPSSASLSLPPASMGLDSPSYVRDVYSSNVALLAAVLFAVHPVHTESIASVVGLADLLAAGACFAAFLCWARSWEQPSPLSKGAVTGSAMRMWLWMCMAVLCLWAGLLCKEVAVTAPLLLLLHDSMAWSMLMRMRRHNRGGGRSSSASCVFILRAVVLVACVVGYLAFRRAKLGPSATAVGHEVFRKTENILPFAPHAFSRWATTMWHHTMYLMLLLLPVELSCDYSYDCIPLITDTSDTRLYAAVLLFCVSCCVFVWLVYRTVLLWHSSVEMDDDVDTAAAQPREQPQQKQQEQVPERVILDSQWPSLLSALLWMLITFAPAANVLFYIASTIAERLLYLPSVGAVLLMALLLARLWLWLSLSAPVVAQQRSPAQTRGDLAPSSAWSVCVRVFLVVALLSTVVWLGYRSVTRNSEWADERTLFSSAMSVCPRSVKVLLNYGILKRRTHEYEEALQHFQACKRIQDDFCDVEYWMGLTHINLGHVDEGIKWLKQSLTCVYTRTEAVAALGRVFQELLNAQPGNASVVMDWAQNLQRLGQHASAQTHYLAAALSLAETSGAATSAPDNTASSTGSSVDAKALQQALTAFEWVRKLNGGVAGLPKDKLCTFYFWYGVTVPASSSSPSAVATGSRRSSDGLPWLQRALQNCEDERWRMVVLDRISGIVQKRLPKEPNNANLHWLWAEIMTALKRNDEAVRHFSAAGTLWFKQSDDAVEADVGDDVNGDPEEEEEEDEQEKADVTTAAGRVARRQRIISRASQAFRRAAKLQPKNAQHLYSLGLTLIQAGKRQQGEKYFNQAAKLNDPAVNERIRQLMAR